MEPHLRMSAVRDIGQIPEPRLSLVLKTSSLWDYSSAISKLTGRVAVCERALGNKFDAN